MEEIGSKSIDLDNKEFQNAWNLITTTHQSVFLTGKAGTGKSTFLRYICENTKKKYIVLAPTGIAAVNVRGMTLHSFFKIPFKPLLPDDVDFSPKRIRKTLKYSKEKVKIIQELDLIIIDEISMVRADIMDFIDKVLRIYSGNMREPFGGKQLLLVGDIFQLEPVVTPDMRDLLKRAYNQFFFFNAAAFKIVNIVPIELRKIYRQSNEQFISILDRVRINQATRSDFECLNRRYAPDYKEAKDDFVITLATRRDVVDVTNEKHLNELSSPEFVYNGEIEGVFPSQNLPTSLDLTVKKDAQVIFIRNDKEQRWINGTLGKVAELNSNNITIELENGEQYTIEPDVWENMQYTYDDKEKRIKENVLGTFKQFPIKLAWALTVHKSQGLTFNKIIIDFAGGAFSSGQTYVALSRCTSLEGIYLRQHLREHDVIVSPAVVAFSHNFNNQILIDNALKRSSSADNYAMAIKFFEQNNFRAAVEHFSQATLLHNVLGNAIAKRLMSRKLHKYDILEARIDELNRKIEVQRKMLENLALEYVEMGKQSLEYDIAEETSIHYGMNTRPIDNVATKSALANFDKAISLWPACIDAHIQKGNLYRNLGENDEAKIAFKNALEMDKSNFEANFMLGCLLMDNLDYPSALKAMKKALRSKKNDLEAHRKIAEIYEKIGLDDLAEKHREIIQRLKRKK